MGPRCAPRRNPGVRRRATGSAESGGPTHVCVGRRGAAHPRRHVVRSPHLVCRPPTYPAHMLNVCVMQLPASQGHLDLAWVGPAPSKQPRTCDASHASIMQLIRAGQLFDFSDLHGFSLTFKLGFYWQSDGVSRGTYAATRSHPLCTHVRARRSTDTRVRPSLGDAHRSSRAVRTWTNGPRREAVLNTMTGLKFSARFV